MIIKTSHTLNSRLRLLFVLQLKTEKFEKNEKKKHDAAFKVAGHASSSVVKTFFSTSKSDDFWSAKTNNTKL